jgi:hypothetical protein
MKELKAILIITTITFSMISCSNASSKKVESTTSVEIQEMAKPVFENTQFNDVFQSYLIMKDAMVKTDALATKYAAIKLNQNLVSLKAKKQLITLSQKIATETDMEKQRTLFLNLSIMMIELAKTQNLKSGAAYVAYCPMADNNNGGFWLTDENAIRNPYFGDRMMKCGKIKETIK